MVELQCQQLKAMGQDITDDHLIMNILVNLPKEYAVRMMQVYQVLGEKKLTVEKLCPQLKLFYTNKRYKVDQIIKSGELALMEVRLNQKFNYANVASIIKNGMTYEDFHNKMGHCGNNLIASTAKAMGIKLIGKP